MAGASVTPYEKNLHVWRQLWRVLERSSVVLQIVDARNPLFYLSDDLRRYAMEELGKPMLMVVNKADYLTEVQRKAWSVYFIERGVDHLFFSAYEEQKKIDEAAVAGRKSDLFEDVEQEQARINADEDEEEEALGQDDNDAIENEPIKTQFISGDTSKGQADLLSREELINALNAFAAKHGCTPEEKYDNRIQYGMVGFPNGEYY